MREKILIFILIFSLVNAKNDTGLQDFFKSKNCDPKCTFNSAPLTKKTAIDFPKSCSVVCADLGISVDSGLSESELTELFKNTKTLIGRLQVLYTAFTSGKFLEGLETIECYNSEMTWFMNPEMVELGLTNLSTVNCNGIDIFGNAKMKKLNMPNIKNITHPKPAKQSKISINTNLRSFCISTQEMLNFMKIKTTYVKSILVDNYCDSPKFDGTLCKKPAKGCVQILGDIVIDSKFDLEIMKFVEVIFGRLTISGTEITDFGFLENLEYVAKLEHKSAILIKDNKQLVNVTFPKLKRIFSGSSTYTMEFEYNNQILAQNSSYCFELRRTLDLEDSPTFDGFSCEFLKNNPSYFVYGKQSARNFGFGGLVTMLTVLVALI